MTNQMKCDEFERLLPDYLEERGLDVATRERADAHRLGCAACAALIADVQTIIRDALELPTLAPSRDLWSGIEARIEAPVLPLASSNTGEFVAAPSAARARLRTSAWRRYAIAASLLVAVTAGVTWTLTKRVDPAIAPDIGVSAASSAAAGPATGTARAVSRPSAEETFDREIATLRKIVDERRADLDPKTAAVLEKNLRLIDAAIGESKAALAKDPASGFLSRRLNQAYDSKLQLLRGVATLPARS